MKFLATNEQTQSVVIGLWEDVCDLDKRIWNVRPFDSEKPEKPLAIVKVVTYEPGDVYNPPVASGYVQREVYSLTDLQGVYLS